MSIDSLRSSADQKFGRLEETVGDLIGDAKRQAKDAADGALDAAERVYGRADDTARAVLRRASNGARSARGEVEDFFADQPVLAAAIALGLGIALGVLLLGGGKAAYDHR
jgi:ElaB/YqjD/DUF883 family membrane-anchored ribosome-binding protein